jgi:hypothetical protein
LVKSQIVLTGSSRKKVALHLTSHLPDLIEYLPSLHNKWFVQFESLFINESKFCKLTTFVNWCLELMRLVIAVGVVLQTAKGIKDPRWMWIATRGQPTLKQWAQKMENLFILIGIMSLVSLLSSLTFNSFQFTSSSDRKSIFYSYTCCIYSVKALRCGFVSWSDG